MRLHQHDDREQCVLALVNVFCVSFCVHSRVLFICVVKLLPFAYYTCWTEIHERFIRDFDHLQQFISLVFQLQGWGRIILCFFGASKFQHLPLCEGRFFPLTTDAEIIAGQALAIACWAKFAFVASMLVNYDPWMQIANQVLYHVPVANKK